MNYTYKYVYYTYRNVTSYDLIGLNGIFNTFVGDRLRDFRILIGSEFNGETAQASDFKSWLNCSYVHGKLLFQKQIGYVHR